MNKIYKVVWNKARNCYVVGSEFVKSHQTGSQRIKSVSLAAVMVAGILTGFSGLTVQAAVSVDKDGTVKADSADINALNALLNGVTTNKDGSVTVGGMTVNNKGEVSIKNSPDVVYGQDAKIIWDSSNATGQISIGKNATVVPGHGGQEESFSYDGNVDHAAGGIAIGSNTYARTGSIMIGSHVYKGNMGDVKAIDTNTFNTDRNGAYGFTVNSTTIGTNSFTRGNLATTIGDYNIQSGKSKGYGFDTYLYGAQNFGATVLGALNSNESQSATISGYGTSGVANSIVGVANRINSSNGTLVFGAGNEVTNSLSTISGVGDTTSLRDASKAQETLKNAVAKSDAGGAVLAIGGANKADWAQKSQLIGVGNTLTGTSNAVSAYNSVNGFKNTVKKASHVTVIGSENQISGAVNGGTTEKDIILGDNNVLHDMQNSIVLGNNKQLSYMKGVIAIGDDGDLRTADNSVAIGQNVSIWRSNGDKGITGNVAIGENAFINSYFSQGDSVAIGKNSTVINMGGSQEEAFAFGKKDEKDYAGAIAIGENTYARSGSTMIGVHDYTGVLGDLTIQFNKKNEGTAGINDYQQGMNTTTVGNNSYNNGAFSTVMGSYTAVSGEYHSDKWIDKPYGVQNFGAAVIGSLNSIESKTSDNNTAGMADSILGSGNRTHNANGTVMIGAGNVVTDSIVDFDATKIKSGVANANELSSALRESVNQANGGGAVSIIGNANEVSKATHVTVLGTQNKVQNSNNQVIGDNHTITGANNVILGSADQEMNTSVNDSVIMGHNANVTVDGGVAIGTSSVADRAAGKGKSTVGTFAPDEINVNDQSTWTSTTGAVSVGDANKNITRQITNVAAGSKDTDAVNVAQLKQVKDSVAVIYDKNKSLRSTNAGVVGSSSIALGDEATTGRLSIALGDKTKATGEDATAIGYKAEATALDSIAIGGNAKSTGGDSIAIGNDTNATSLYSVAIGDDIHFTGNSATAVGQQAHATGDYSTALGAMTNVDADYNASHTDWRKSGTMSTAIGYGSGSWGDYSTAIGGGWAKADSKFATAIGTVSQATAENATAVGSYSKASGKFSTAVGEGSESAAENAVALGVAAKANVYGGVALGTLSVADKEKGVKGAFAPEKINATDQSTWISTAGAVSVGDTEKNITRQITHVAAGREDTDAVNVAQLKRVNETANKGWNLSTNGKEATNVKPGDTVEFAGDDNISVTNDGTKVKTTLNKDLTGIETIANGPSKVVLNEGYAGMAYGDTNVVLMDNGVYLNGKVNVDKAGQIHNVTAGIADEDAVNVSQLKGVESVANKGWNLSTNGSKEVTQVKPGETVDFSGGDNISVTNDGTNVKTTLNKNLQGIESITNGDARINLNETGIVISKGNDKTFSITDTGMGMSVIGDDYVTRSIMVGKNGTVITGGLSVAGSKITNVAAGTDDTDAVNVGQLKQAVSEGNTDTHIKAGEYSVGQDNTVSMDVVDKNGRSTGEKVTIKDVAKASDVGDVSKIANDIKNKEGNTTVVDAVNNVNNKVGDLKYSTVTSGDINDGDNTTTAIGKLNQKLSDVEQTAGKHSSVSTEDSNLSISEGTNTAGGTDYKLSLNKKLKLDSITTGDTKMDTSGVTVGDKVSLTKDGLKAGDTKITSDGLSIGDKTYVSKDGLNANNQKITNVADGKVEKGSTDAVNGGQLYETNQSIANNATNISSLSHSLSNLDNRVNKVGAGAAALAALHPLDFDPDAKWDFAAGYGNYRGTNAAAVGAYYRPNEDTMFSVGGTFGNGENMVNAGVSFKLGAGSSHVSTSRVAMAKEIKELRSELEAMKSAMLDANAGKKVDTSKLQLFPDVPQNHWAYEYVAQLAGNGMIEGYPDGNFAGDRPMTRYEFAAILYRAMTKGAVLSDKILSEFSHELEYFTVDTVSKDKAGNPTIQRVRTVKANKNK